MDVATCEKVVIEVQDKAHLDSKPKAIAAIPGVCQRGGTNRSAFAGTASYTIDGVTSKTLSETCLKNGRYPS